ncbi:LOW QUALITY PROTEIN: nuclear receptor subfamily 1 group I member 3 [Megaptera novaeangliae]
MSLGYVILSQVVPCPLPSCFIATGLPGNSHHSFFLTISFQPLTYLPARCHPQPSQCLCPLRRTVSKSTGLTCPFAGSWKVNKAQRRHCPACRLQKCLDAGMKKDMIPWAEARALRARQARRRAQQASMQQEERELVQTPGAQTRHMGTTFHQFVQFRPPAHLFTHHQPPTQFPVLPLLTHFADINAFMVQQIIRLTKDLPLSFVTSPYLSGRKHSSFLPWPMEDQISLLKEAAVECHIALNTTFCLQTQNFLCGPLRYTVEDGVHVGFQEEFFGVLFGFHRTLHRLQLQEPEYVFMDAMALFSWEASLKAQKLLFHHLYPNSQLPESIHPGLLVFKPVEWVYPSLGSPGHHAGHPQPPTLSFPTPYLTDQPGITQREGTDQLQEEIALTLQSYIKGQQQNPWDQFLYAKLLGLLAELRSINDAYWYQIANIQGLSTMVPLLQETCS